jgi:rSAM/selenodomain-associated transferase 1
VNAGVGLMARAPSAAGKTRLAPYLSADRLHALRSALLADTLQALEPIPNVILFFTPDESEMELARFCDFRIARVPQSAGDLGERMHTAMRDLIDMRGYDAGILVGSDTPWLGADDLREAANVLRASGGVVLGPADDGGYYLVGMMQAHAPLFEGVAWGTGTVLADTMRAAERVGIGARLLRPTYDVDTIDDLRRLERDLGRAPGGVCPHMRRWFNES